MRFIDRLLFEKTAPLQVRHLSRKGYGHADTLSRALLDQMDADFVIGPPLTVHISNPPLMAGVWSAARECIAAGREGRPQREVVAAAVSRLNTCPYCYDIHTSMLHSWGRTDLADAMWDKKALPDAQFQKVAEWASATLSPEAPILAAPPFTRAEAPAIIGTAVGFHYLNRIVNVFLEASPVPFKGHGWFRGELVRLSGRILKPRLARQNVVPGKFLIPLAGELPEEFAWARGDANIEGGFQRFAAYAEAAGKESVDPSVRNTVVEFLTTWNGETPPLGRAWLELAVANLPAEHRAAGRLALLVAVASYQADDALVADYTRATPGDRHLINLVAWAAYRTARRIASWLPLPAK